MCVPAAAASAAAAAAAAAATAAALFEVALLLEVVYAMQVESLLLCGDIVPPAMCGDLERDVAEERSMGAAG